MKLQILYMGDLRTESTHLGNGSTVMTDGTIEDGGKGEVFTPGDLLADALGACMMTVIALKATNMGIDLKGTKIDVSGVFNNKTHRITDLHLVFDFPELNLDDKNKKILEEVSKHCPVGAALSADIVKTVRFNW